MFLRSRRPIAVLLQRAASRAFVGSRVTLNALPSGWESLRDAEGSVYYHDKTTGKTQWEPPKIVAASSLTVQDHQQQILSDAELAGLRDVEQKVIWLSTYMIHHANNIRPNLDGLKVGGHQASSTSLSTVLTYLYMKAMLPQDRCAVKPHAGPVFHALQYLLGQQSREQLELFRSFGGVQSYPSRTKDSTHVDFSTGSVGLGAACTTFASLIQDFLVGKGLDVNVGLSGLESETRSTGSRDTSRLGRMIALVGDAEMDEGNVYESLLESQKLAIKNNWWIIDYNRQSLDKITEEVSGRKTIERMFRAAGWEVITLKYGRLLQQAFSWPVSGQHVRRWLNSVSNHDYSVLVFKGGSAFRAQIQNDIGDKPGVAEQLAAYTDDQLFATMTDLGGHCFDTLAQGFAHAESFDDNRPVAFICYTVKGHGLHIRGHQDNHGLFLNDTQIEALRGEHNIPDGQEWEPYAGLADGGVNARATVSAAPLHAVAQRDLSHLPSAAALDVPDAEIFDFKLPSKTSTQAAFGQILYEVAKTDWPLADRIVTMAPDVTTSTNLSGFLNQRGLFSSETREDAAKKSGVMSVNQWVAGPSGQHVELGIAENNLFLLLAAAGLSTPLFGHRLLPIGTLYDPFIARGLDALNYGCYQDSRFMVVATPSGITLGPEGGAHQSINTPMIGMGQPNLLSYEPATADELQTIMAFSFRHMQDPDGSSIYLRLSTRTLEQPERELDTHARRSIVEGGYWHDGREPCDKTKVAIVFSGALLPEARAAAAALAAEDVDAALLQVLSPDRLHAGWAGADGRPAAASGESHVEQLLSALPRNAVMVTVNDAHPASLSWLGGVAGHRVRALGVSKFGQSGNLVDLYAHYGVDTAAIVDACQDALREL